MKKQTRAIRNAALLILLSVAFAGCSGNPAGTAGSTPPKDTSSNSAPETQPAAEQTKDDGAITQEDTGIKIRIDMPEINAFLEKSEEGPIVPALMQDAVPQGIAYLEENNWLIVSSYREDGKPSLLSVIDAGDGKFVKAVELYESESTPYTGHAGGVTASRSHLWISSGNDARAIATADLIAAENGAKLVFKDSVHTDTRASFTTYSDGVLWVGEYAQGVDYPTEKSHYLKNRDGDEHRAWAVGFKLDETTDLLPEAKAADGGAPVTPDYLISLPDRVQGMLKSEDSVWISRSYGRNSSSNLTEFKVNLAEAPHTEIEIGGQKVPLWFLDSQNKASEEEVPPMSEGIVDHQGTMYILFESGATKYRSSSSYALDRILTWKWK